MLGYKVQPDHIHLVIKGVIRTSATVQWMREAARVPPTAAGDAARDRGGHRAALAVLTIEAVGIAS
ncbi:MAG TPA: hypothetical protein VFP44_05530 [Usitatibacter sp.]|nr:hypothetical protein [Usitatibacter sp.]